MTKSTYIKYDAHITRTNTVTAEDGSYKIFYDAEPDDTPDQAQVFGKEPASRWAVSSSPDPLEGIKWQAAKVGSPCIITVFNGVAELHDVRESMEFEPCSASKAPPGQPRG